MEKKRTLNDIDNEMFMVYIDGEFYGKIPYCIVRQIQKMNVANFSKKAKKKIKELSEEYKTIIYS